MAEMMLYNQDWTFLKTALETGLSDIKERKKEFKAVDIPHDWLIYQVKDLYENSTGWYCKVITKESLGLEEGEKALLRFDGVYMDSTLYVNEQRVGDWKYGYSAFEFDITDYLTEGEHELLLQVRFQSPNSRWYSGAGIYRHVWLKICPKVYLPLDGTYVHTEYLGDGKYLLDVETECAGELSGETACVYRLYYKGELYQNLGMVQERVVREVPIHIPGQETTLEKVELFALRTEVDAPKEWSLEEPNCYELVVELLEPIGALETCGNAAYQLRVVDSDRTTIGFRRLRFDPDKGFFLNEKYVKINGVCEHHDFGCLGAAFYKEAMRRKFEVLRTMGVNALRTSHNMPAKEVMELADEMGFLVLSEAFDMWERPKTDYDYGRFFKEWAGVDVRSWIRRDRNHPSLFLWSIGNEIYDTHAGEHGQEITRRLIDFVREHDPRGNARITIGSNYMPWENAQKCADIVKMAGYNYSEKYYAEHHKEHPDWVIYGSETASLVHSRGVYKFPLSQPMLSDEDEQCSALGNSTTSWGAKSPEACIFMDRDMKFSFGQFLWTGFDYIGEPTPYHTKNSYFGQLDTAGFPKDSYYMFQSAWTDVSDAPMVHVYPYWDFNEGQVVDVRACTNGCAVELFVNGVSQGKQEIDHNHGKKIQGTWQVSYEPGEITVVGYDEIGAEIARETRYSFGDAVKLTLEANKQVLRGDGEDLVFLIIGVLDAHNHLVENAMNYVEVLVSGVGRLLGLDNGDSTDYDEYKGNVRKLFNGKLLAVVASKTEAGEVSITVSSPGLESASLTLQAEGAPVRPGSCATENLMDAPMQLTGQIPVRRVEIKSPGGTQLTKEKSSVILEARVLPENATDKDITWKAVNDNGIEIPFAWLEVLESEGGLSRARLTALGDGAFQVRCFSKSGTDKVKIISQLGFVAEGLGQAFTSPYEFVSAGLFTRSVGEIGNGNEKGVSTARDGISGVSFENLDFGEYGSDEITIPVFALDSAEYEIELWEGDPSQDGVFLDTLHYQKPSIWNVYQEETWKLPRRLKGVTTVSIMLRGRKVHIKGFSFKKQEKSFSILFAAECDAVYGDTFTIEGEAVTGIGNNVTLVFENMNFGEKGATGVEICSRSPLKGNTVHVQFTTKDGTVLRRILEISGTTEYQNQYFEMEPLAGEGKIEFIFLPGTNFDMKSCRFC
ncbi:MAG: DUF4982 domain-containing protein [Lachnospiraceae bacterium]|nr:DUF4982 domain-containing protein [Lachnospiraceae bacterium]